MYCIAYELYVDISSHSDLNVCIMLYTFSSSTRRVYTNNPESYSYRLLFVFGSWLCYIYNLSVDMTNMCSTNEWCPYWLHKHRYYTVSWPSAITGNATELGTQIRPRHILNNNWFRYLEQIWPFPSIKPSTCSANDWNMEDHQISYKLSYAF